MATDQQNAAVKEMIQSFYRFANVLPVWDGEVNERVAEVFGIMLNEAQKCSNAMGWIPTPPGGRASIVWLAMQVSRVISNNYRARLSFTCAREVLRVWGKELQMASMGISARKFPTWA